MFDDTLMFFCFNCTQLDERNIIRLLLQEDAGGGLVFWHPKGSTVRRKIEDFWKEAHIAQDYDIVYTPHIANLDLWKTSGHYDFYREGMFDQMDVENEVYQIKPIFELLLSCVWLLHV